MQLTLLMRLAVGHSGALGSKLLRAAVPGYAVHDPVPFSFLLQTSYVGDRQACFKMPSCYPSLLGLTDA